MRLNKRLLINGRPYVPKREEVRMGLSQIGGGTFVVALNGPPNSRSLVEFYVGVGEQQEYLMLSGAITEAEPENPGFYRIVVRELTAVLQIPMVLNLRQPSLREIIAKVEEATGLRFLLPAGAVYLDEHRHQFSHQGSAADALTRLAKEWDLPGAVWYQLPDGQVFWGHWRAGPYTRANLPINSNLITKLNQVDSTLHLPCIPPLRPGMVIESNFRFRINALIYSGEEMTVHWEIV
ncbi:MAG: hypothetical protein OEW39_01815 [Deltaproteobacteria bacterium]|nr:hypothetical protein [Deltaproteobacteria bacterium]